jgi:hypothetical protein
MRFWPRFRSCIPGHRDPESWARILGKAPQVLYARMRRVEVGARVGVSLTEASYICAKTFLERMFARNTCRMQI